MALEIDETALKYIGTSRKDPGVFHPGFGGFPDL